MNQQSENLPPVPFSPAEFVALRDVLDGYVQFLRNSRATAQRERCIVLLAGIAQRLTEQLHHAEGVQLTLNGAEIDALLEALRDFAQQIERLFPHTPRRDLAVATITGWQARVLDPLPGIN